VRNFLSKSIPLKTGSSTSHYFIIPIAERSGAKFMDKDLIFVVDDDTSTRRLLTLWLEKEGYEVLDFEGGEECLRMIDKGPSAICLDIMMPGMDGIEVLKRIKKIDDDVPVIMITAQDRVDTAVETMREGAYDYLVKPIDKIRFETTVRKSLENYALIGEVKRIRRELKEKYEFGNIIGKSKKVQGLFEQIDKVLRTNITVLIEGETGTGKELVARAIHHNSARKHGSFIASFLALKKGPLLAPFMLKRAKLRWPIKAPCFWMRYLIWACQPR
jgi:DNA-binding NtrC family response regulator